MRGTISFNGECLFGRDKQLLLVQSWRRESVQRGCAGLDGVISLDLGRRERKIRQQGRLTAGSVEALLAMIKRIAAMADGHLYELVDQNGLRYGNVRMDGFRVTSEIRKAAHVCCNYEIDYTQLNA